MLFRSCAKRLGYDRLGGDRRGIVHIDKITIFICTHIPHRPSPSHVVPIPLAPLLLIVLWLLELLLLLESWWEHHLLHVSAILLLLLLLPQGTLRTAVGLLPDLTGHDGFVAARVAASHWILPRRHAFVICLWTKAGCARVIILHVPSVRVTVVWVLEDADGVHLLVAAVVVAAVVLLSSSRL